MSYDGNREEEKEDRVWELSKSREHAPPDVIE
jgi:hypothetical protein